jgi:hypothetical protein
MRRHGWAEAEATRRSRALLPGPVRAENPIRVSDNLELSVAGRSGSAVRELGLMPDVPSAFGEDAFGRRAETAAAPRR